MTNHDLRRIFMILPLLGILGLRAGVTRADLNGLLLKL